MNIKFLLILIYIILSIPKLHSNLNEANKSILAKKIKDKKIFNQIFDKTREDLRIQYMEYYGIKNDAFGKICLECDKKKEIINLYAKAESQCYLGYMYLSGKGVNIDYVQAKTLFEEVVGQEINLHAKAQAQLYLGVMYYNGNGVNVDYEQAKNLFEKVIGQEVNLHAKARAQVSLGEMYCFGNGINIDYAQAKNLFDKAADQEVNLRAQLQSKARLGEMYCFGFGIPKNYLKAKKLYEEIANQNVNILIKATSQYQLAAIYFFGYGVDKDYKKSKSFLENLILAKVDHHISVMAMLLLGAIEYLENNHNKAKKLFEEAILKNSTDCEFKVVLPENKNNESLPESTKKAQILIELLSKYIFTSGFDINLYFEKAKALFEKI